MREQLDISYQIGNRFAGSGELLWTLRQNLETLTEAGVAVPLHRAYRNKIAGLARTTEDETTPEETQEDLLTSSIGDAEFNRAFFLDRHLMGPEAHVWDGIRWFPEIGVRAAQVRNLFPDANMGFFVSLQNPASFLSALISSGSYPSFSEESHLPDPFLLSWRDVIEDLRAHVPDAQVTVWCQEELPFVFERVLLSAAGLPEDVPMDGYLTHLEGRLTAEGLERLRSYLAERNSFPATTRARIMSVFADKFALDQAREEDLNLPVWTRQRQEIMDQNYANDIRAVAALDGVEMITTKAQGSGMPPVR